MGRGGRYFGGFENSNFARKCSVSNAPESVLSALPYFVLALHRIEDAAVSANK
jgi:hypothetical protein